MPNSGAGRSSPFRRVAQAAPSQRRIGHQVFRLAERIGILEQVAVLAVGVDVDGRRLADRRHQLRAGVLLPAAGRVEHDQLAHLPACDARWRWPAPSACRRCSGRGGSWSGTRSCCRRTPSGRAVGVHLEQRLRKDLPAIVVFPAGVEHAAVLGHGGEVRVHLVESQAAQVPAVAVAAYRGC